MVTDAEREGLMARVREDKGRVFLILSPDECEAMKDLLERKREADLKHEDRLRYVGRQRGMRYPKEV